VFKFPIDILRIYIPLNSAPVIRPYFMLLIWVDKILVRFEEESFFNLKHTKENDLLEYNSKILLYKISFYTYLACYYRYLYAY
jgi:hypothetical protein